MNGLMAWMEKYILPTAAKIGAQKHLVALRDAFIGTLPATMAGSVAVMINAIIRIFPRVCLNLCGKFGSRQRYFCSIECHHWD